MNTKNNKRYKINCEKIETAFLTLILNHKYEDITISQICETAKINRSTFYAHYDDINDLTIKIESKFANSFVNIFNNGLRQNHEAFVDMFTFVEKNKYFYKAFLNIPYTTLAEKNSKIQAMSTIKDNLNNPQKSDIELYYRANFFGAGIKEICKLWLERDCKETPEQMATFIFNEYTNRKANDIFE